MDGLDAQPLPLWVAVDSWDEVWALRVGIRISARFLGQARMKLMGFALLVAGWALVVSAIALLPSATARAGFVLAGVAVELGGLALVVYAHLVLTMKKP